MVTPNAFVGDIHPLFARPGGLGESAVEIDDGAVEEVIGLLRPDAGTSVVGGADQRLDVARREAPAEVACRRWVGDAGCAQGIQKVLVVAAQLDVLQANSAAQRVVGNV